LSIIFIRYVEEEKMDEKPFIVKQNSKIKLNDYDPDGEAILTMTKTPGSKS